MPIVLHVRRWRVLTHIIIATTAQVQHSGSGAVRRRLLLAHRSARLAEMQRMIGIGQIEQRLNHVRCKDTVLLPQIEHTDNAALVLRGASEQIDKRRLHVARETRCKDVLFGAELMAGLAHDRIDDVQTGNLVFGFALQNELLDALHDVLVELDGLHGALRDGGHFRFGDGRPGFVEPRQLEGHTKWSVIIDIAYAR